MINIHKTPSGVLAAQTALSDILLAADLSALKRAAAVVHDANARAADAARAAGALLERAPRAVEDAKTADATAKAAGYESDMARLIAEVETAQLVVGATRVAANAWATAARAADKKLYGERK